MTRMKLARPILLLPLMGALAACSGDAKECFSDTGFPASAVEQWKDGIGALPASQGQRWLLSLKKETDSCGVAVGSFETEIVIKGTSLPDPQVATLSHIDVPVEIVVPGRGSRVLAGHQYTPEALRKEGQTLEPSYVYAASNFPHDSAAGYYQCSDAEYRRREVESVQFSGMTARTVPSVRVAFSKGVFSVAGGQGLKSCWVEYTGTARVDSK
jgi:hypothetical protein